MTAVVANHVNRAAEQQANTQTRFSLVLTGSLDTPALTASFRALEALSVSPSDIEILWVLPVSAQVTVTGVRTWMQNADCAVRLVTYGEESEVCSSSAQAAAARNLGLSHARGSWIVFPDSDEAALTALDLTAATNALRLFPDASLLVSRLASAGVEGSDRTQAIDLASSPNEVQRLRGTAFFNRSVLAQHELLFAPEVPLHDLVSDLVAHFLLSTRAEFVSLPAAGASPGKRLVPEDPEDELSTYAAVFTHSHAALLERAGAACPGWLANIILVSALALFQRNRVPDSPVYRASAAVLARTSEQLRSNLRHLGKARIAAFDVDAVPLEIRASWFAAAAPLLSTPVEHVAWKPAVGGRLIAIYSTRPFPPAKFRVVSDNGRVLREKRRRVEFLGDLWVYQTLFIVATTGEEPLVFACNDDNFRLMHGGRVVTAEEHRALSGRSSSEVVLPLPVEPAPIPDQRTPTLVQRALRAVMRSPRHNRRTWLFLALPGESTLQSEALYAHVRHTRPDIDVQFVASTDSAELAQLRASGFEVSERGSSSHYEALQRAQYVIVSRVNTAATLPFTPAKVARHWKIVLLPDAPLQPLDYREPGMAEADFVPVSSTLELERATGPYGGFHFFRGDAAVTGLPHHDALEGARVAPTNVVFAPSLRGDAEQQAASLQAWNVLLNHDALRAIAEQHTGAFQLLIPSNAPRIAELVQVPAWVQQVDEVTPQVTLLGAAQILVTDYSRLAFDAAYLQRPTVYFHPDHSRVLGAGDSELNAASAFRDTGFGPVSTTAEQALQHITQLTREVPVEYRHRADRAFEHRDGRASDRLVQHLTNMSNW